MNDRMTTWLRALLTGDFDEHRRLTEEFGNDGVNEIQPILTAAFFGAVDRRFKPGTDLAEIVQLVADTRAQFDSTGDGLDARLSEYLIRIALGEDLDIESFAQGEVIKAQGVLLYKLAIVDDDLSGDDMDAFVSEARELARSWQS